MAISKLYFLSYKNYYNKQTFKLDTIADYAGYVLATQSTANFNPNDGVDTTFIANFADNLHPDYMVETQTTGEGEEAVESIVSRWYIIDAPRARQGQYRLTLHRDLAADYADALADATCYIEKGWVRGDNPLVFNAENGNYNEIKSKEQLLRDQTSGPYLVAYLNDNIFANGNIVIDIPAGTFPYTDTKADTAALLAAYPGSSLASNPTYINYQAVINNYRLKTNQGTPSVNLSALFTVQKSGANYTIASSRYADATITWSSLDKLKEAKTYLTSYGAVGSFNTYLTSDLYSTGATQYANIQSKNGTIVKVGNAEPYSYYRLSVNVSYGATSNHTITNASYPNTEAAFQSMIDTMKDSYIFEPGSRVGTNSVIVNSVAMRFSAVWTDISDHYKITIPQTAHHLSDAPYYMFVWPYNQPIKFQMYGDSVRTSDSDVGMAIARHLVKNYGSSIYDIQILPYFPAQDLYDATPQAIHFKRHYDDFVTAIFKEVNDQDVCISFMYYSDLSSFAVKINQSIPINIDEEKIDNETTICRLQSPNFASSFDFSPAKNSGVLYFNADCKYSPYTPYIHIAPQWGGIYTFDAAETNAWRAPYGLICAGDFSIDIITSAWTEYKLANKNYQASFDREIKSLDLSQNVQRSNIALKSIPSILGSGMAGAMAGGLVGGIAGTIGGTASVIGSGLMTEATLADQKSAKIDQFNYALGNIKAQPDTLQKVTTINRNNKLIPFYEMYTCTAVEKQALKDAMQYGGMQIGVIGKIPNYCQPEGETYIKGKIVRIDIGDDTHLARTLSDELNNGLYFTKE